jgi:hypothetical protein
VLGGVLVRVATVGVAAGLLGGAASAAATAGAEAFCVIQPIQARHSASATVMPTDTHVLTWILEAPEPPSVMLPAARKLLRTVRVVTRKLRVPVAVLFQSDMSASKNRPVGKDGPNRCRSSVTNIHLFHDMQ